MAAAVAMYQNNIPNPQKYNTPHHINLK